MSDISTAMDQIFRFKVRDLVVPRARVAAYEAELRINGKEKTWNRLGGPIAGVIGERELRECHGGIQGFYLVYEHGDGVVNLVRYPEHAVSSYEDACAALAAMKGEPEPSPPVPEELALEAARARVEQLRIRLAAAEQRLAEAEKAP